MSFLNFNLTRDSFDSAIANKCKSYSCGDCIADYKRWTIYPRRAKTVSKYEPPECQFDGDSNYRMTYQGHQGGGPPPIVRPRSSSLQRLPSEAPFDARTNYRDEFTGRQQERAAIEQPAVPEDTVLGLDIMPPSPSESVRAG